MAHDRQVGALRKAQPSKSHSSNDCGSARRSPCFEHSLDDPDAVQPAFHLYVCRAPTWMNLNDDLPRYEALRPATRGLAAGQTEV
jgi:hypothetical protein